MRYTRVPGTDLNPANIVIGCVCAVEDDPSAAFHLMDIYREHGGNIVDSANVYGKWFPGNRNICDINVGCWLKKRGCRNQFYIVSKGGHPPLADWTVSRLKRADVLQDLEESLRALDCGAIDMFYLHRDDPSLPAGEIIEYLNEFVREGKIRYFGCSNWRPARIQEAQEYAHAHGLMGFTANQLMWSLADIEMKNYPAADTCKMDADAYKLHEDTGMAAFAYSALALGFFSQYANRARRPVSENTMKIFGTDTNKMRAERAIRLSEETGIPLTSIVLAYLLDRPFASYAQISTSRESHLLEALAASEVTLTSQQKAYLTENELL